MNYTKTLPNSVSPAFVTGGRATFTVKSVTGEYFTYKVKAYPSEMEMHLEFRTYFAYVMTGPDNDASFSYIGIVRPMTGQLVITAKSKFSRSEKRVAVFLWATDHIWNAKPMPPGYQIKHAGKCGKCGRKLTTPESIDRATWPRMLEVLHGLNNSKDKDKDKY